MPLERARRAQNPLKFRACHYIGKGGVIVCVVLDRVKFFETRGKNDCSYVEGKALLFLFKINGTSRTKFFTGPAFTLLKIYAVFFVYGELKGNRLGVRDISSLSFGKPLVVFIVHLPGAFFRAHTARDTFVHINKPGVLEDFHLEIASFATDRNHLGKCDEFYVKVPADLDQLG